MSPLVCVANKRLVQYVSPLDDTYKKHRAMVLSQLTRNPFGVRQLAAAFPASKSDSHGGWLPGWQHGWLPPAPARRLDFQLSTFDLLGFPRPDTVKSQNILYRHDTLELMHVGAAYHRQ